MKQHWKNEHARCEIVTAAALPKEMQERVRELVKVQTDENHRGQGYATELVKAVCDEADLENIVLMLQPQPFDINISKDRLISFYKRFGFVKTQDKPVLMARAPSYKVRQSMVGAAVEKVSRG